MSRRSIQPSQTERQINTFHTTQRYVENGGSNIDGDVSSSPLRVKKGFLDKVTLELGLEEIVVVIQQMKERTEGVLEKGTV